MSYNEQETSRLADAIILNSIKRCKPQKCSLREVLEEVKQGVGENWADFPVLGATRGGLAPAKEPPGKKPEHYKLVIPGTVFYNPMRILSLARGAVRERILFKCLAEGEIELPSIALQKKASTALAELKPMRGAIEQKLNDINLLPQKILAKAFEK